MEEYEEFELRLDGVDYNNLSWWQRVKMSFSICKFKQYSLIYGERKEALNACNEINTALQGNFVTVGNYEFDPIF